MPSPLSCAHSDRSVAPISQNRGPLDVGGGSRSGSQTDRGQDDSLTREIPEEKVSRSRRHGHLEHAAVPVRIARADIRLTVTRLVRPAGQETAPSKLVGRSVPHPMR
jgi:hypothetical protein